MCTIPCLLLSLLGTHGDVAALLALFLPVLICPLLMQARQSTVELMPPSEYSVTGPPATVITESTASTAPEPSGNIPVEESLYAVSGVQ